jgi:DNA-binding SARP family transcriptional activator
MSACDASPGPRRMEEAWERLLCLEHEVRELRRMLLAGESRADPCLDPLATAPEIADEIPAKIAPTLLNPRAVVLAQPAYWQATCLGPFQLRCGGQAPSSCSSRRGWGILQFLLVRPGRVATRDTLIEVFWPGIEPSSGAHSLQMAVHALRRALRGCGPDGGDETVLFRNGHYGLNPTLSIDLDVDRFRKACGRGRRLAAAGQFEPACRAFEAALALYGGPFLRDTCPDEWAEPHRATLEELRLSVLGWLSSAYAAQAEWEQATACCGEILAADPYREDAIRQLLHCLAAMGRLAEVERTYRACRERLWQDLQVEPAPETIRLYRQLTGASAPRSALSGS